MTGHVLMVTDKSGSMAHLATDVIGGFNSLIEDLKSTIQDCKITVVLFDTIYYVICVDEPIGNAPKLNAVNYVPNGFTALYDAVGRTITEFDSKVGPELDDNDRVTIVIQTDGHENASEEHTAESVKALMDAKLATGKWNVIYIGAGPDTWAQAQSMGVRQKSYLNTRATGQATHNTYEAMSNSVKRSFSGDTDFMEDLRKANKNT